MKVLKFGGTSVGTAQRIRNLAEIIPSNEPIIVVLSAMSGTTNSLIEIADEATKGKDEKAMDLAKELEAKYYTTSKELFFTDLYKKRGEEFINDMFNKLFQYIRNGFNGNEYNETVATGELLSTGLFHLYLSEQKRNSAYISALSYMKTNNDKEPDYSYITESLEKILDEYVGVQIFITQGFICRNSNGEVDNLGRGGSDYSAAILGNIVNAKEVQIWTDIDGIHNNDPRFVSGTTPIRKLSFDEAAELAYFGAKILHPSTIYPCSRKGIPVILKNTLQPSDSGTIISHHYNPSGVKAIAAKDGITAIKIRSSRMLMAHGFLKRIFQIFDDYSTSVDMITTSEVAVSLTIDNRKNLDKIIEQLSVFSTVEVDDEQTIICIVGDFVADRTGYADRIFNTLKNIPIRMISYGGSYHNVSILVSSNRKIDTLRALQKIVDENKLVETNALITIESLGELGSNPTPFYFYDTNLLDKTLIRAKASSEKYDFEVHYAIKANANRKILTKIASYGLGADCVSGNEIELAIKCGFDPQKIVFAGVGKTDSEIEYALNSKIFCFHCESVQELIIINQLASQHSVIAKIALRLNPDVKAGTHAHITTGMIENKFGLSIEEVHEVKNILPSLKNIMIIGLHYHIGSQITDMEVFKTLSIKANQLKDELFPESEFNYLNMGGGLGIDYSDPSSNPIPDFEKYFSTFYHNLKRVPSQKIHFELGRAIVAQCGSLITKVTYTKGSSKHQFAVVDAGMNDLLRPALYGASHTIINLSSTENPLIYDVVGPVCESADCFAKEISLPQVKRGDILAILSSGAYGEVMSSRYNMRDIPYAVYSE